MTAIHFYHLTATPLERALPKLLNKAYEAGMTAQVILKDEAMVEQVNTVMWTFEQLAFLPHGSLKDGQPERQPVLLVTKPEPHYPAHLLCLTTGQLAEKPETYNRVIDVFDGHNEESVAAARTRWAAYKDAGHELTYWKQDAKGAWEKAA